MALGEDIVHVDSLEINREQLEIKLSALKEGKTYLDVSRNGEVYYMDSVYVHKGNVITTNTYLGNSRGAFVIPLATLIYLIYILYQLIRRYSYNRKKTLYDYANVRDLGMIIFFGSAVLMLLMTLGSAKGIDTWIRSILSSAYGLSILVLPLALIISILVTISNLELMRKEGRSLRNMLGCFLGVLMCVLTLLPDQLYRWISIYSDIDIQNAGKIWTYLYIALEEIINYSNTYLECILLSTVILALSAARRIPSFDRDAILILGSQIRSDGGLTNLLKGRADRAVEFAKMQKEATGKDILFVPTGGKGDDEVISEGEAIKNYLVSIGIAEEQILSEERATNTRENFRYSLELIQKHGISNPKIAFSTTNYHVFRSGILAHQAGIQAEGIGSKTKRYFWINAFVREFIATLVTYYRTHLKIIGAMILMIFLMAAVQYISNIH